MLKILIFTGSISTSLIEHNGGAIKIITELPEKLFHRVVEALNGITFDGVDRLEYEKPQLLLLKGTRNFIFHNVERHALFDFVGPLVETLDLLDWYLGTHIYSHTPGGVFGSEFVCSDCNSPQIMYLGAVCGNLECPSHEKWAQVDDKYTKPDVFKRAWMGLPKVGEANSWTAKG